MTCFSSGSLRTVFLVFLLPALFFSCKKSDSDTISPSGNSQPELVQNLNGFRFDGRFTEDDPDRYYLPELRSIDEYNDSVRIHVATLSKDGILPSGYKWHVANLYKGKITRSYKPLDVVMDKKYHFQYAWNHPNFELGAFNKEESYVNFYKPAGGKAGFHVSKPNNNFPYIFTKNFTVFFESQGSVYLFEHGSQTTLNRFVLSSEPSIVFTDTYLDPDFDYNGYVYRANFITAFFNPTFDGNYIGIARGGQTIDTLLINKYNPIIYPANSGGALVSKVGDTLVMGLVKRRTANVSDGQDLSVYRILPGESELKPVFTNVVLEQAQSANFHKGHFYLNGKRMNDAGVWEDVAMPKMKTGYTATVALYGKNRLYVLAMKNEYSFEIYSRPY